MAVQMPNEGMRPSGFGQGTRVFKGLAGRAGAAQAAFTLVELMLVMSMLLIVIAVSAPSLGRFFRGRTLDSEVRRFLALTHYGENRAVSEGLPILLWIDLEGAAYGLEAETPVTGIDSNALEFSLSRELTVEIEQTGLTRSTEFGRVSAAAAARVPTIRFTPDGFIDGSSPESIVFRHGEEDRVWIGRSRNRLHYEIQTNPPVLLRR